MQRAVTLNFLLIGDAEGEGTEVTGDVASDMPLVVHFLSENTLKLLESWFLYSSWALSLCLQIAVGMGLIAGQKAL